VKTLLSNQLDINDDDDDGNSPLGLLYRMAKGTARSSLFLSSFVSVCFLVPCLLRNIIQRDYPW
jgi:hypothetical protein